MLVLGQKHYHKNFRMCASLRVNEECQYSHEPLEEQTEAMQAELFDANLIEADNEAEESALAGQLLSSGAVSAANAGVANSGGTAPPTSPADGQPTMANIGQVREGDRLASERQANDSIEHYKSANPEGQTEEEMLQAELLNPTAPPPAA